MAKKSIKKRNELSEDDSNSFAIIFTLIKAEKPMSLSEIAKKIDLPANLVFYHLKNLKDRYLVLETEDKKYACQPILTGDSQEDLDALFLIMIKLICNGLEIENPTEKTFRNAVIENLRTYIKIFEIETE